MKKKCEQCGSEFDGEDWQKVCRRCYAKLKQQESDDADKKYNVVPVGEKNNIRTQIWKGQAFNAAIELAKLRRIDPNNDVDVVWIFGLADKIYKIGVSRGYTK